MHWINWIIDLVLLLIIILCAWRGFRNGLIAGVLAVCAVLFSVYAADILADTYSGEFTKMLEPFVTGVVDTASTSADEYFEKKGGEPGVYEMTRKTLEGVGFMKSAAKNVWIAHGAVLAVSLVLMIFAFSRTIGYALCTGAIASAICTLVMRAFQLCFTTITSKPSLFGKAK